MHTHTYTRTRVRTYTHIRTRPRKRTHASARLGARLGARTRTPVCERTRLHARLGARTPAHTGAHAYARIEWCSPWLSYDIITFSQGGCLFPLSCFDLVDTMKCGGQSAMVFNYVLISADIKRIGKDRQHDTSQYRCI